MHRAKKQRFPSIVSFDQLDSIPEFQKFRYTIRGAKATEGRPNFQELFYRGSGKLFKAM